LILDLSGEPIELGDADGVLMRQLLGNSRARQQKNGDDCFHAVWTRAL
jgi:hypothetical protein